MGEIKIVISDKTEKIVNDICNKVGIKKTEFIKSLLIENLKEIKLHETKMKK